MCESFYFISTTEMRQERRKLGYALEQPTYVICAHIGDGLARAARIIASADVVLCGGVVGKLSKPSYYRGKTVFYYTERLYKCGCRWWLLPYRAIQFYFKYLWRQKSLLLCASAYAAYDYSRSFTFRNRCFRWGYFPETKEHDIQKLIAAKDSRKILWCGRLIGWKHPELAVQTAVKLRDDGVDYSMDIIGSGEMEPLLRKQIADAELEDRVKLLGSMPPQRTREHMEQAGILLFTSDRQEGWGAVLNEAMNSGCAVVASSAAGSVPYLISNGQNGVVYPDGHNEQLYQSVKMLLQHPEQQETLGSAAHKTITELWNAETAAKRLIALADCLMKGNDPNELYQNGPCSKAPLFTDCRR